MQREPLHEVLAAHEPYRSFLLEHRNLVHAAPGEGFERLVGGRVRRQRRQPLHGRHHFGHERRAPARLRNLADIFKADEPDESTVALRAFNDMVAADTRVESALLTLGDGLTLLRKR